MISYFHFLPLISLESICFRDQLPNNETFRRRLEEAINENHDFIATVGENGEEKLRENIEDIISHYHKMRVLDVKRKTLNVLLIELLMELHMELLEKSIVKQNDGSQFEPDQIVAYKLELALRWNASDFAASHLFTDSLFLNIKVSHNFVCVYHKYNISWHVYYYEWALIHLTLHIYHFFSSVSWPLFSKPHS